MFDDMSDGQKRLTIFSILAVAAFGTVGFGIYMQGHAFGLLGLRAPLGQSGIASGGKAGALKKAAESKTTEKQTGQNEPKTDETDREKTDEAPASPKPAPAPSTSDSTRSKTRSTGNQTTLAYNPFTGETHEVMQLRHKLKKQELKLQRQQKQLEMEKIRNKMESLGQKRKANRDRANKAQRLRKTARQVQKQAQQGAKQKQGLSDAEKKERDQQDFDDHDIQAISPIKTSDGYEAYMLVDSSKVWVAEGDQIQSLKVVDVIPKGVTLEAQYGLKRSYPYTYGGGE